MGMSREELELMTDLKRICNQAPEFALEFMAGSLSIEAELAYARRLIDVADALMHHANIRKYVVVEGQVTSAVIQAELCAVQPGRENGDSGEVEGER